MKTFQLAFIVTLLLCVNQQVFCQLDLSNFFGPESQSVLTKEDFDTLISSNKLKVALNKLLYQDGDSDVDGYLSLEEFGLVYARFIHAIGGQTPSQELTEELFNFADFIVKDNYLNYKEFIWAMGTQLSFLASNSDLLTHAPPQMQMRGFAAPTQTRELPDLSGVFNNPIFNFLFNAFLEPFKNLSIDLEKFKQILKFIADFLKCKFDFSDCVLNGFLNLADTNGDGRVNVTEMKNFLKLLFNNLGSLLQSV